MNFEDIKNMYHNKVREFGTEAYKYVSEIFIEAKEIHRSEWLVGHPNGDHEQSWRSFKGNNLEKLIQHIISNEVGELGLTVVNGSELESRRLSGELDQVKRNLVINYGEFGMHLPDADIVIYRPTDCKVLAILSSKVTLRERIAQTGYWKLKLMDCPNTDHIKVYFVTPDEDGTLTHNTTPAKKPRAIVEIDLDGSYVLTRENIEESEKVKLFEHFIEDLGSLVNN